MYKRLPRGTAIPDERRNISPGVFEFLSGPHDGVHTPYINALQSEAYCRKLLHDNAERKYYSLPSQKVKLDINAVGSDGAIGEDRTRHDKVPIRPMDTIPNEGSWWSKWLKGEGEEALMMSVIDGHGGAHVAELAREGVHACIAWAMCSDAAAVKGDDEAILRAIKQAYTSISQDIANTILDASSSPATAIDTDLVGMPSIAQLAFNAFEKRGGAPACTAVIYKGKLYVAGLGDCRMVAIWHKDGKWSTRAMFDDHNLWNPAENDRLRAQHPNDPDILIPTVSGIRNWLKGGLLPTRCIGDVSYNRTDEQRDQIEEQLGVRGVWPKSKMISPPYLGWEPDVAVYDATDLRFLILASDGLWDKMTSKEAALGTIAHAQHPQQVDVPWHGVDIDIDVLAQPWPSEEMQGYDDGCWIFDNDNAGTFLIQNALCGGDRELLRQMLSLKHGTKLFRDDMTAMVASFERVE